MLRISTICVLLKKYRSKVTKKVFRVGIELLRTRVLAMSRSRQLVWMVRIR